jgi:hypothetical protein
MAPVSGPSRQHRRILMNALKLWGIFPAAKQLALVFHRVLERLME